MRGATAAAPVRVQHSEWGKKKRAKRGWILQLLLDRANKKGAVRGYCSCSFLLVKERNNKGMQGCGVLRASTVATVVAMA